MAATLTQERFTGAEWTFERKFDGIRLIAFKEGTGVRLLSRNHLEKDIPMVAAAVARLSADDAILDGELTWDGDGVAYHVFDILWVDGRNVARLGLTDRRRLLDSLLFTAPLYRVTELGGDAPWDQACTEGWEGVIAKRRDSIYEEKRSKHWLKMKCELTQEFVVGGFTDPQGARAGLGALLVGYYAGDDFVFAGKVGTGFDAKLLRHLRAQLDALEVEATPFTRATGLPRLRQHWVTPKLVVRAAFIEWTRHGKLRHSRLIGLSDHTRPRDVVRGDKPAT